MFLNDNGSISKEDIKIIRKVGAGDNGAGQDKVPNKLLNNPKLKELLSKLILNNRRK